MPVTPAFDAAEQTADGFTVAISNYDAAYSWDVSADGGATATLDAATATVTVTDLAAGASATLSVTTTKAGHAGGLASATGAALSLALTPELGALTATAGGFTVVISNYDAAYTWAVSADGGGSATLDAATATVTVAGLAAGASATLTVTTTRAGHADGVASVNHSATPAAPAPTGPPPIITAHAFTAYQIMYNIVFSGRYEYIGTAVIGARDGRTVTSWLTGSDPLVRASDGIASDYGAYLRTDGHYALVFFSTGWGGEWTHVYPGDATGDRGSNLDGTPFTTVESIMQADTTSEWGFSNQTQQFITSASDNTPYKKLPAGQSNNDTTVTEVAPGVV